MSETEFLLLIGSLLAAGMGWAINHIVAKVNTVETRVVERMVKLERRFDDAAVELRVRVGMLEAEEDRQQGRKPEESQGPT